MIFTNELRNAYTAIKHFNNKTSTHYCYTLRCHCHIYINISVCLCVLCVLCICFLPTWQFHWMRPSQYELQPAPYFHFSSTEKIYDEKCKIINNERRSSSGGGGGSSSGGGDSECVYSQWKCDDKIALLAGWFFSFWPKNNRTVCLLNRTRARAPSLSRNDKFIVRPNSGTLTGLVFSSLIVCVCEFTFFFFVFFVTLPFSHIPWWFWNFFGNGCSKYFTVYGQICFKNSVKSALNRATSANSTQNIMLTLGMAAHVIQ